MKLNGIHHISAITGDARRNVDFYAGVVYYLHGIPEDVAGRDLRQPVGARKPRTLRALAGPRRAQQDNPHLRKPS